MTVVVNRFAQVMTGVYLANLVDGQNRSNGVTIEIQLPDGNPTEGKEAALIFDLFLLVPTLQLSTLSY